MAGVVVSEFRKASSTSAWWALLIPVILFSLAEGSFNPGFDVPALTQYSTLGFTSVFAIVFGVVCASSEYRHRTIATSYLVIANRAKLVAAKMTVAAVVGAAYALISTVLTVAGLLMSGFPLGGELAAMFTAGAGAMLVVALGGMLGVGLGTLISNQLLAVLATLVYLIVVEPVTVLFVGRSGLTGYLPGQSADAALGGLIGAVQFLDQFGVAQPWWLMLLVFAGWVAVVGLAGTLAAQRRDIA